MKEKTTSGGTNINEGLNEGNPNTERTPIQERQPTTLVGGLNQSNYDDEVKGDVPRKKDEGRSTEENE
jgi:hypothetical protein